MSNNSNIATTAKLHGERIVCPMCESDDCLIWREPGKDWNSFKCHHCGIYASETAVRMTLGAPICPTCKKVMHKDQQPFAKGRWKLWNFRCMTGGCPKFNQPVSTEEIFRNYEVGAFLMREHERQKILAGHAAAKKRVIDEIMAKRERLGGRKYH